MFHLGVIDGMLLSNFNSLFFRKLFKIFPFKILDNNFPNLILTLGLPVFVYRRMQPGNTIDCCAKDLLRPMVLNDVLATQS